MKWRARWYFIKPWKKIFSNLFSTWEKCVSLNCGNFRRTTHIHQPTMLREKKNFRITFMSFRNWNDLMPVKDHTSVTGFVTSFSIIIAFLIMFSSPRHNFIWAVTSTLRIIECGHLWILKHTRKQAFIHWKYVYGVSCLISYLSVQSSSSTRQLLQIQHGKPCNFFNYFLQMDWFLLVYCPHAVQNCSLWTSNYGATLRTRCSELPLPPSMN